MAIWYVQPIDRHQVQDSSLAGAIFISLIHVIELLSPIGET